MSICFVDWQMSYYNSPVLDLLYNIFTSTDGQYRENHYEKLLKTYYSSLTESIEKLGSDPTKFITYNQLQDEFKKFGQYGLLRCCITTDLVISNANDVTDMDHYAELIDKGVEVRLVKKYEGETQQRYVTAINDIVTDLVHYGYVQCK